MEEKNYRVLRIEEQLYGCEELPEASPCSVMSCGKLPTARSGFSPTRMPS